MTYIVSIAFILARQLCVTVWLAVADRGKRQARGYAAPGILPPCHFDQPLVHVVSVSCPPDQVARRPLPH